MVVFYAGVFSIFSCLGIITAMESPSRLHVLQVVILVLIFGGTAVGYAWVALRGKYWYLAPLILLQVGSSFLLGKAYGKAELLVPAHSVLDTQLSALGAFAIVLLGTGYALFITFFAREGGRYFRTQTEIELAGEIHRSLVPRIHKTLGRFEIYGASLPSGEVGGDLVDLLEHDNGWMAYVADVSGHGVSSGVLMAMFKTAVHTRPGGFACLASLLEEVNRTLFPLKTPNMFVTSGFLGYGGNGQLSVSLAGHPPLLHYCARLGSVNEVPAQNLPMGILAAATFTEERLDYLPGDVFVLLTDGLTEVVNYRGDELGAEPIKSLLQEHANEPLQDLFERLREASLNFGRQEDDQTMLLIRCIR
jgi:sigma-B regulation protein RsbU (phosphoserine phosphatase)